MTMRCALLYFVRSATWAVAWASMTSVGVTRGMSLLAATPISPRKALEKDVPCQKGLPS